MKRWGQVCASIGIVLALAGVMAVYGFSTLDIAAAKEIEARRPVAEGGTDAAPMPAPSEVR
jgi:hypothetical protein